MITRIIWLGIMIGIALVTVGAQLDRQARVSATLASVVPESFRAFAQARIASSAVVGDDPARALEEAKRLVERRPVPAEHIRLLANAQFKAEQIEQLSVTVQVAAQRGWRDTLSQQAMLELALAAGDGAEAARRYAALLLNSETENELLVELGTRTFAQPNGAARTTLAEIVNGGERWHGFFLRRGGRVMPEDAFIEVVTNAKNEGSRFSCQSITQTAKQMANRNPSAGEELTATFADDC